MPPVERGTVSFRRKLQIVYSCEPHCSWYCVHLFVISRTCSSCNPFIDELLCLWICTIDSQRAPTDRAVFVHGAFPSTIWPHLNLALLGPAETVHLNHQPQMSVRRGCCAPFASKGTVNGISGSRHFDGRGHRWQN